MRVIDRNATPKLRIDLPTKSGFLSRHDRKPRSPPIGGIQQNFMCGKFLVHFNSAQRLANLPAKIKRGCRLVLEPRSHKNHESRSLQSSQQLLTSVSITDLLFFFSFVYLNIHVYLRMPSVAPTESQIRDKEFSQALHGKKATDSAGYLAILKKDSAAQQQASNSYFQFWDNKAPGTETEQDLAARSENYTTLVNSYYNLATDLYEYGWSDKFHFCRFYKGEGFHQVYIYS